MSTHPTINEKLHFSKIFGLIINLINGRGMSEYIVNISGNRSNLMSHILFATILQFPNRQTNDS